MRRPLRSPPLLPRTALRGFTLVEVLVALFVMAIMTGMAWRGIDGVVRARDAGQAEMQRSLRLTNAVAQWEIDLRSIRDTGQVPAIGFDGSTLRFTRSGDAGVQLVAWSVREGRLLRWAAPPVRTGNELQQWWLRSQQLNGSEREQLVVLEGLPAWQVFFYRVNAWTNAQSSADVRRAPQPQAGSGTPEPPRNGPPSDLLPNGVRVVWEFEAGKLTRDVALIVPQDGE
jgi:general secretion pathway protein J